MKICIVVTFLLLSRFLVQIPIGTVAKNPDNETNPFNIWLAVHARLATLDKDMG